MRILNTEPGRFNSTAREALAALGAVENHEADRRFLLDRAGAFDAWLIGLRNVIDKEVLSRAANLQCIATPTTGTDHIDIQTAQARGITILSLAGEAKLLESITATAEHTWGLLLALVRQIPAAHQSVLAGEWARDRFVGNELLGKALGIVGYGRLGRMVAQYGQAFGMSVLAFDRTPQQPDPRVEFVGLTEVLGRSDVVSVHLALTRDTEGFLDRGRFGEMKEGALLVNTARGKVLDEAALLDALRTGKLSGAAVDVLSGETGTDPNWLADSELRVYAETHANLLITPHIGGLTSESVDKTNMFIIEKLARHMRTASGG